MPNIRIKDIPTTASATSSTDFIGIDGSANGTRKLNAFSPTFGGNVTVSGTGGSASTISTIGTGTNAEQNSLLVDATTSGTPAAGYGPSIRFTRKGNDGGSSSTSGAIKSVAIAGTGGNQYNADVIIAPRLGGSLVDALTVKTDGGATLAGNLTVSGTGNNILNSGGGNLLLGTTTDNGAKFQVEGFATFNRNGADGYLSVSRTSGATGTFGAGTSNAYLGTATNHSLVLYTNNVTALTLDSSQNATFAGKITANGAGSTFKGTSTNDDAAAGYVGEIITSTVESGSAVSLTSATLANITSISLTAGDWDVFGVVGYSLSGATVQSFLNALNNTSAAIGPTGSYTKDLVTLTTITDNALLPTPVYRFTLTSTSTVYLIGRANFTAGTVSGWGHIRARRVR